MTVMKVGQDHQTVAVINFSVQVLTPPFHKPPDVVAMTKTHKEILNARYPTNAPPQDQDHPTQLDQLSVLRSWVAARACSCQYS